MFIPGFEDGRIPSFLAKPSELDEEHRVLLVMLSRARHGAVLTRAETLVSKKGNTYPTTPCRWTAEVLAGPHTGRDGLLAHIAGLPD